jgi:hypothetical protein
VNGLPLDELYLIWLYRQVADPETADPSLSYWKLLRQLYTTEFVWLIHNDENRVEDGKDLRVEFIHEEGLGGVDPEWIDLGCSVLELMVGLSRKLAFQADDSEPHFWFWRMMENIGLRRYTDSHPPRKTHVDDVLHRVIYRKYHSDGSGGFFPLKYPEKDQRNVELWYQMSAYIIELEE